MHKIWAIAWKELYTTLRDRNLLLIMFATPLALSTIIGLAFGGLGSDTPTIAEIPVAVVNLDRGLDIGALISDTVPLSVTQPVTMTGLPDGFSFNVGTMLASILLSQPITASGAISTAEGAFDVSSLNCNLVAADEDGDGAFQGSLDDLLAARALTDPAAARAGVEQGDYAVAVIIPPDFTQRFLPTLTTANDPISSTVASAVEVYGNSGRALSAGVVRSIVEGIVNQFLRLTITLEASFDTLVDTFDLTRVNTTTLNTTLNNAFTTVNTDTFAVLGCLFQPGINPIQLDQRPLDTLQAGNRFAFLLVVVGSAQAVFFALFTGVFGILSIYEERKQWTLQRILVSPTSGNTILLGKLVGNLVVVVVQMAVLLLALTGIASLVLGTPTFIWGTNPLALVGVLLALALCVSGIGVLIVGLARTPEQVQVIGPMVNMALGVLGGSFGFALPAALGQLSLIYWGVDAFTKIAANEPGVGFNFLVLVGQGLLFFVAGTWFFRRRLNL
ncbi:MAG: ABC transporter permease [Caldilinea sp. CFX5]|nr:ABC transporter permease [Caldilinea sp. CFX5]